MSDVIKNAWEKYRDMVVLRGGKKEPDVLLIVETKHAFYAGAIILLAAMLSNLHPGDSEEDEKADLEYLNSLQQELMEFKDSVLEGTS